MTRGTRGAWARYPEWVPIVYIGLGANLPGPGGSPEATMTAAVGRLGSIGCVAACSSLYSTEPVGLAGQPRFLNAVVGLETALAPHRLLEALLRIERAFGRDRAAGAPNGPRTLDLDILLHGDLVLSEYDLAIPHPRMAERAFVLIPLGEIAPEARDPRTGLTVAQLSERVRLESASERGFDAVVRIESGVWRAGACGAGEPADVARAEPGSDPDHG